MAQWAMSTCTSRAELSAIGSVSASNAWRISLCPRRRSCSCWIAWLTLRFCQRVRPFVRRQRHSGVFACVQTLETFAAGKFKSTKRFGLEGVETLVPGTKTLVDTASQLGVESVVFGMPHRGRLNVLANVVRKPMVCRSRMLMFLAVLKGVMNRFCCCCVCLCLCACLHLCVCARLIRNSFSRSFLRVKLT